MDKSISRRHFLQGSTAFGAGLVLAAGSCTLPRSLPIRRKVGDKLNVGVIGVGGRGAANLQGVAGENIIALCDVDRAHLAKAAGEHQDARTFVDFRDLLQLEDLDAVVISTPDHTHAPAAAMALRRRLDVYCEKPLAHDLYQTRLLTRLAGQHGAVTQMGTQIHSWDNYRRAVERVQAGQIGAVLEVHVFVNGKAWAGNGLPTDRPPLPAGLYWDLWLGPAVERPYHPSYHPAGWRRYWDFGGGTMADMACHYMDLAFWALDLKHPTSITADGPEVHPQTTPAGLRVVYSFPARGSLPPVELTWYDGDRKPPVLAELGLEGWKNGVLFIGAAGHLIADYNKLVLGPGELATLPAPPQFIAKSIGHYQEWIEACKTRGRTTCGFDYSGPLTEAVLLGNVSYRCGRRLEWDARDLRVVNGSFADDLLRREARRGWQLQM